MHSDRTLVILAGGQGERMGMVGKVIPKPLMLTYDEPLLIRQLRQGSHSSLSRIIVSANDDRRKTLVEDYIGAFADLLDTQRIDVISNPMHSLGTIAALRFMADTQELNTVVMSFGDVFFTTNPFPDVLSSDVTTNWVFGCIPDAEDDLANGGIVFVDIQGNVCDIVYPPIPGNRAGFCWSGLAAFSVPAVRALTPYTAVASPNSSEEEFIKFCIDSGLGFRLGGCPQFTNVNTLEQLHALGVLRRMETRKDG